jgi:uncharacterized protein with FMN-binding domain
MKKYFQITFFLGAFGFLVLVRQLKGTSEMPLVAANSQQVIQATPTTASTPTPANTSNQSASTVASTSKPNPVQSTSGYKNGIFTGSVQDASYGNVQVQVIINGGKITDVNILQYPNDNRTSQYINSQAMPMLKQEALSAQNANISGVSGASFSSPAFAQSLQDALAQAKS